VDEAEHLVGRRTVILTGLGALTTLLAACASTSSAGDATASSVNVAYTKKGRLIGTVHGQRVDMIAVLPGSPGTVSGRLAGERVDADWQITYDGTSDQTVLPVTLHGSLAGQDVALTAVFRLQPDFLFDSGTVSGNAAGQPVQAQVSNAPGQTTSSVNVDGSFAGTAFSLYGTVDLSPNGSGLVKGTVGGKPVQLNATFRLGKIRITGDFNGPPALFGLAAGGLIYFLGGVYA